MERVSRSSDAKRTNENMYLRKKMKSFLSVASYFRICCSLVLRMWDTALSISY